MTKGYDIRVLLRLLKIHQGTECPPWNCDFISDEHLNDMLTESEMTLDKSDYM